MTTEGMKYHRSWRKLSNKLAPMYHNVLYSTLNEREQIIVDALVWLDLITFKIGDDNLICRDWLIPPR